MTDGTTGPTTGPGGEATGPGAPAGGAVAGAGAAAGGAALALKGAAGAAPPLPPGYVATYYTGQLPAPQGPVALAFAAAAADTAVHRTRASNFYEFLNDPASDLRDLNGDTSQFTALVSVPDSPKVKLVYGLGIGTATIGQTSPVANKLLALFGEGGGVLGPAQALMVNTSLRDKVMVKNLTAAEIETVFQGGNHAVDTHVQRASNVRGEKEILGIAPIPAYLVWDGFDQDLDAIMVYERLMDCQHDSPMRTHALTFLRSCMVGVWRAADLRPSVPVTEFYSMLPRDARVWAHQRFQQILPTLAQVQTTAPFTPPRPNAAPPPQGAAAGVAAGAAPGIFQLDAAAIKQLLEQSGQAKTVTPEKTEEFKVSEGEKGRMRKMCGLPDNAGDDCFPKWYRDLFEKHLDDASKAQIIAEAIDKNWIFEDAEVPLYPGLIKTILNRDWCASDLNRRAALVNAAKGLSPFAMMDLTEDDVAEMIQDSEDMVNASTVTAADFKAARARLAAKTPEDAEAFMTMLKRFTNLLFALFSSQSPLYKQLYAMVRALRSFSTTARANLSHSSKTSILWIVLLQARRFSQGKMEGQEACLPEFSEMVREIRSKNCSNISHDEVPTELLHQTGKRKKGSDIVGASSGKASTDPRVPEQKKQKGRMEQPYSTELADFFKGPCRDAGNPKLGAIANYCGITKEKLIPDLPK